MAGTSSHDLPVLSVDELSDLFEKLSLQDTEKDTPSLQDISKDITLIKQALKVIQDTIKDITLIKDSLKAIQDGISCQDGKHVKGHSQGHQDTIQDHPVPMEWLPAIE